jgi:hypothetical protein
MTAALTAAEKKKLKELLQRQDMWLKKKKTLNTAKANTKKKR